MRKKFILFLFLPFYLNANIYYVPCEPSIEVANLELETKIKINTKIIKNKSSNLLERYEDYNSKLSEYNDRLQSYKTLQTQRNLLLLDIKNNLKDIKNMYFLNSGEH